MRARLLPVLLLGSLLSCGEAEKWPGAEEPTPDPFGDDDTAPGDDDTVPDDDDTAPDDDDTAPDDDDGADAYEGDEAGECGDGADNDQDGLFDCDDPTCEGSPACTGDDDTAPGDDDTAPDDDDTAPDDDDATASPGDPVITNVAWAWNAGTGEFEFTLWFSDSDCDLGNPPIHWVLDGAPQTPAMLPGPPLTCSGVAYFYVGGLTAGYSYTFGFWIQDLALHSSPIWTVVVTAA